MDIKLCPGCGQSNACMAGSAQPEQCWCMQLMLSGAVKARLPETSQCYCESCLQQMQQQAGQPPQRYSPGQL